jgi:hypothetical protein
MRRRPTHDRSLLPDELGQDSFLDTIANLVGVLIILVVVVGSHARQVSASRPEKNAAEDGLTALRAEIEESRGAEAAVRADYVALQRQIAAEEQIQQVKARERHELLTLVVQWERDAADREAKLDEARRAALSRQRQLYELDARRQRLEEQIAAAEQPKPQTQTIDHFPTPIAKTVFRDDVHFRLKQGRLAFVPLDELAQRMRGEWELKAEQLAHSNEIVETVGPIDGFRLQYKLVARTVREQTSGGIVTGRTIEFDHFVVVPLVASAGEAIDAALAPGGQFLARLDRLQPQRHTISVWVYPDSYAEFNRLKRWLYERGFQTAAWPLSQNGLISGGPNGNRPMAE